MDNDELRQALTDIGVKKVAEAAGVKPTTLYSFCSGDTRNLRSDTRDLVLAAIRKMRGEPEGGSAEVIDIWSRIPDRDRATALRMLEGLAGKNKPAGK